MYADCTGNPVTERGEVDEHGYFYLEDLCPFASGAGTLARRSIGPGREQELSRTLWKKH